MQFLLSLLLALVPMQAAPAADATAPPAGAVVVATAVGSGVQIYACQVQDGQPQWVFQAPAADLFDPQTRQHVGVHAAGPSWTWADGSALAGTVKAKQASPDAHAIPWLLVEVHSTGSEGVLSHVAWVRRSETQAGQAPATGCDASQVGTKLNVPYQALYTFYRAAQ
ncbi:Protein of unknown function [Bryocella elongata]|uniref:DUF3455 domain-containing protein n=1 Tax=Bryocella elongata TaxID=863522 RepID=A0A1H5SZT7_9BACT|nr:DUF3455 domain-containing protein [Bryocella elongata]SEF56132.1 Protein of unknown function [Bryocella elongata]